MCSRLRYSIYTIKSIEGGSNLNRLNKFLFGIWILLLSTLAFVMITLRVEPVEQVHNFVTEEKLQVEKPVVAEIT